MKQPEPGVSKAAAVQSLPCKLALVEALGVEYVAAPDFRSFGGFLPSVVGKFWWSAFAPRRCAEGLTSILARRRGGCAGVGAQAACHGSNDHPAAHGEVEGPPVELTAIRALILEGDMPWPSGCSAPYHGGF
jgi:hypothetical protein